jgi:hypothetical protein
VPSKRAFFVPKEGLLSNLFSPVAGIFWRADDLVNCKKFLQVFPVSLTRSF